MPTCKSCDDEVDELVSVKADGRRIRVCEDCAERIAEDLELLGRQARAIPDPAEMVEWVSAIMQPGDVIALCSNGKFGGAHAMMKERITAA